MLQQGTNCMSSQKLQRDYTNCLKMSGAKPSAQAILGMLKKNYKFRSGILGVNDKLEIVFSDLFIDPLKKSPVNTSVDEANRASATGIVAFDVCEANAFVSDSKFIRKLDSICESAGLTLIDLMLFGTDDWMSLRQQNRI